MILKQFHSAVAMEGEKKEEEEEEVTSVPSQALGDLWTSLG